VKTPVATRPFEGLAEIWLALYGQKRAGPNEAHYLAPLAGTVPPHTAGDLIDAARTCLQELGWAIDDGHATRPRERRQWDTTITAVLQQHPMHSRGEAAIASHQAHLARDSVNRRQYMGQLMHGNGLSLYTSEALFKGVVPLWFEVLQETLRVTRRDRLVPPQWAVSATGSLDRGNAGQEAANWQTLPREDSAIYAEACEGDHSTAARTFREQQRKYAARHGITYESVGDGTGGGGASKLRLASNSGPAPRQASAVSGGGMGDRIRAFRHGGTSLSRQTVTASTRPGRRSHMLGL
jgi:hypothetical protein